MTIGRDLKGDIAVDDGKVFGSHAMLIYSGGTWAVIDQGSTNGTYLNGQKIVGQQSFSNGGQIRIGDTTFVFGALAFVRYSMPWMRHSCFFVAGS